MVLLDIFNQLDITKILNQLQGRLQTCQKDYENFDLLSKKGRKSCYCIECDYMNIKIIIFHYIRKFLSIIVKNKEKLCILVIQNFMISNTNMSNKSFQYQKQKSIFQEYQILKSCIKIQSLIFQNNYQITQVIKAKFIQFEIETFLDSIINSPFGDQSSQQQYQLESISIHILDPLISVFPYLEILYQNCL
ncbi:unnamed protein product [Paramecium pentaurelia]|uniref:Uncharacterized protein n=1 Tax=Paramecium pentaurelia TaxID=43138 RepID=A0A8S1XN12_9CILI|nr:unnamed protein product [Paramecium pentaurelia]